MYHFARRLGQRGRQNLLDPNWQILMLRLKPNHRTQMSLINYTVPGLQTYSNHHLDSIRLDEKSPNLIYKFQTLMENYSPKIYLSLEYLFGLVSPARLGQ